MELISLYKERINQKRCRRYQDAVEGKLFLTVADSDFKVSDAIVNDVIKEVKTGIIAYSYEQERLANAVKKWYWNQHQVEFTNDQILFGNGVLYWIHVALHAFTKKDDPILIMPPTYNSFEDLVKRCERRVITNPLIFENAQWKIDFNDLENKMQQTKLLILCSPHNPTGNVWSKANLDKINQLAIKYKTKIIVDEIWQDIILQEPFTHSLSLSDQSQIIHIASPAKTFNLGGLHYGHMICKNPLLFKEMKAFHQASISYSSSQPWIVKAVESAYTNPENLAWKNLYLQQIKKNTNLLKAFLDEYNFEYAAPESLYLFFVKLGNGQCLGQEMINKLYACGVQVTGGSIYGPEYCEWARIDIAIDDQGMEQLINALKEYNKQVKNH